MAASTIQILNTKITKIHNNHDNHINFSDNFRPHSHSFGQVSLPMKNDKLAISSSARPQSSVSAALFASPSEPKLAEMWREIQGCDDWEDLMEPLNPLLRREIIRYGEFVAASYKAFDLNPASKRYLNCKYGKKRMLRETGLAGSGYEITKYIYATPDIEAVGSTARWIGYVAVSTDEAARWLGRRDVLVTFRGTVTNPEWIANLMSNLTPARLDPHNPRPEVKVESGFLSLYTSDESASKFGPESCREQVLSEVSRLLSRHRGEDMSLSLAGHSMGSSLANLLAYDIAELGLNKGNPSSGGREVPVTVFSFGGPRVGNLGFKRRCEELGVKVLRVVNVNDPITKMPGVFFNDENNFRVSLGGKYEFPWSCSCYAHVGVELVLDFFNVQNPSCVHDLETYIHLLKCPKRSSSRHGHDHGGDEKIMTLWDRNNNVVNDIIGGEFFSRAKEMILSAQESLNMLPWVSAAGNMVNLVQSQRT